MSPLSGYQLSVVVTIIIVPLTEAGKGPRQAGLLSTPVASVLQEARSAHAQRHSGTASVPQCPTAPASSSLLQSLRPGRATR